MHVLYTELYFSRVPCAFTHFGAVKRCSVPPFQAAAETAYDMVSPVPDERDTKKIKRFSHYGLAHQPVDLREGVAKAYTVVKEVQATSA